MDRIEILRGKVTSLYEAKNEERDEWADLLFETHVFVVANNAHNLSKRFGISNDLPKAAAMLHDIADAVMSRFDEAHTSKSLEIACDLLVESGFETEEINIICVDILPNHSCRDGNVPQSLEGKIMATADAKAHLDTDFYIVAKEKTKLRKTPEEYKVWVSEKIERDYNIKIFFDEVRAELKPSYEHLKEVLQLT